MKNHEHAKSPSNQREATRPGKEAGWRTVPYRSDYQPTGCPEPTGPSLIATPTNTVAASFWRDQIANSRTLTSAAQIRASSAPGVDGVSPEEFRRNLETRIQELVHELRAGTYRPERVRQVDIPKPEGGTRRLGIPTVRDRVVQVAVATELVSLLDCRFHPASHGFRPWRGVQTATAATLALANEGRELVAELDLARFFDTPDHQLVLGQARRLLERRDVRMDGWLKDLLLKILTCGVITPDQREKPTLRGLPQGGPLSPVLANVVLHALDEELEQRGLRHIRYADDIAILANSRNAAKRNLRTTATYLSDELGLRVNREKSGVRLLGEFVHLGIGYRPTADATWTRTLPPKTAVRLLSTTYDEDSDPAERLQQATDRTRGRLRYYNSLVAGDPAYIRWEAETRDIVHGLATDAGLPMPDLDVGDVHMDVPDTQSHPRAIVPGEPIH